MQRGLNVPAVISLASAKGGCAKTTTALALGLELALDGARVAVLDADPNQHAAEFGATFARTKQALPEGAGFAVTPISPKTAFSPKSAQQERAQIS